MEKFKHKIGITHVRNAIFKTMEHVEETIIAELKIATIWSDNA